MPPRKKVGLHVVDPSDMLGDQGVHVAQLQLEGEFTGQPVQTGIR